MTLPHSLSRLLQTLEAHVLSLKDEGVRTVEWQAPPPLSAAAPRQEAPAAPAPAPSPAPSPAQAQTRQAPAPAPAAKTAAFLYQTAQRLPECADQRPEAETLLGVLSEKSELAGENLQLLENMLAAIGYRLHGVEQSVSAAAELSGTASRILCFGDGAQQLLSPMKMALNLVRGKWQRGPHGKFMALSPPSYLQNNPSGKKATWADLQNVLKDMDLGLPPKNKS